MNKRIINISSLEELEAEERKVRRRIKKQEVELMLRVKELPEQVVTTAITKLVSGILQGGTIKSILNFVKKIGKNVVSNAFKDIL